MDLQKARCGLISTVSKVHVYSPCGDYSGIPSEIPIAADGIELVGVFHSTDAGSMPCTDCRRQMRSSTAR